MVLGGLHTCAFSMGRVYCFGCNDEGQLGDGMAGTNSNTAVRVLGLP